MIDWDELRTTDDLTILAEDHQLEVKIAQGRDGQGEVPKSFWESYSAFANTGGGIVLFGVQERDDRTLEVVGLGDPAKVQKALWDGLHNRQVVNTCILGESDVKVLRFAEGAIIGIRVPQALRQQRPVHLGESPFGSTFRRNHEGDYKCDDETVRRMLAEQVEDERDARILPGYGLKDLDAGSFRAYRSLFTNLKPEHPYSGLEDPDFLHRIGAWREDREAGKEGVDNFRHTDVRQGAQHS